MTHVEVDATRPSPDLALLIFLPDAMAGHMVGPVERWLRDRTACVPIARRWFAHTDETLRRFYPELVSLPFWPLVSRAFSWSPCLVTLWFGANAARLIPAHKGLTHPASCSDASVRGRFWCDNSLTNLIHVSDSPEEVVRELGVLRAFQADLFEAPLASEGLPPYREWQPSAPRHSGILTLCALLMTELSTRGAPFSPLALHDDESARETLQRAEAWLDTLRPSLPASLAAAIRAYLDGSTEPAELIAPLEGCVPVSPWQRLVLTAGLMSRPEWLRQAPRKR